MAAVADLKKLDLNPKYHQLDIEDIKSIERLRDDIQKTHGGLDVLVNNAGFAYKVYILFCFFSCPFSFKIYICTNCCEMGFFPKF